LAIGNVKTVNDFVVQALKFLGVQVDKLDEGYRVFTTNLPKKLKPLLGSKNEVLISFDSPTPKGFKYLGRNHIFVEQMCQELVNNSIEKTNQHSPSRASVIRTNQVKIKTTLMQFRVRNVISEQNGNHEIVAEEMFLWGFQGDFQKSAFLSYEEANKLLFEISPTQNLTKEEQNYWLEQELENLSEMKIHLEELSKTRAEKLVEAHERFRKVVGGKKFKVVEPVFPMDLMGIYVILPEVNFDGGN
ncbi:MAG: helicase, partial [Calditrichaeota bacterium]